MRDSVQVPVPAQSLVWKYTLVMFELLVFQAMLSNLSAIYCLPTTTKCGADKEKSSLGADVLFIHNQTLT